MARQNASEFNKTFSSFVSEIAGRRGAKIVDCIGDGATDESIEKKTGMKLSEIRSTLNNLHSYGVVEYLREKNLDSGWFIYTWKLNHSRAMKNFLSMKQREYVGLKQKLSRESTISFSCKLSCLDLDFDAAMDLQFKCPKCKKQLVEADPKKHLDELEGKISAIQSMLENSQPLF